MYLKYKTLMNLIIYKFDIYQIYLRIFPKSRHSCMNDPYFNLGLFEFSERIQQCSFLLRIASEQKHHKI